jgi:hypothetical protein
MTELGRDGDVQEIEVTADSLVGTRIEELDIELPDGVRASPLFTSESAKSPPPPTGWQAKL